MCVSVYGCACVRQSGREIENVSAARCCRAAAALIREGEDGPSVSVDSGLWEHTGQLRAACDRQSLFP